MGTLQSLNSLAMIFIMIIPGIILAKKNVLSGEQEKGLSSIVANLTWPCLVIDAMQISFSKKILAQCGYTFIIMVGVFVVALGIATVLVKVMKMEKHKSYIFTFMLIFANTGFMGIPVINALYGKSAVFYASIVEMVQDLFLFTAGIMLIQMSTGAQRRINLKAMLSPGIFGVAIGFCLFLFDLKLPGFLGDSIGIIGDATTPLTMIAIGLQIGHIPFKELVGDVSMYVLSFAKLIVVPGILLFVMIFVLRDTSMMSKVVIMEFAMPVAACATIFSQQYGADVAFATKGVLLSTVISIATLSVFTVLLDVLI
jgi:predicted permease